MMLRNIVVLLPLALAPFARAVGTVQDLWNSPEYPDYTSNYTAGTTVEISWQHDLAGQFAAFCPDCDITNVDLWLTGSSYTRKLEAGMNVNTTTNYNWNINLDNDDVEASTEWTFRFLPADVSWGSNDQEISSAKFNLEPSDDDTSSSSTTSSQTSTSTSTTTSTPTSTTTTTSSAANPTSTSPENTTDGDTTTEATDSDDGLSTGAQAGIGVGVAAGVIILAALAFLLYRRFKALPKGGAPGPETANAGAYANINGAGSPGPDGAGYFAPAGAKAGVGAGGGVPGGENWNGQMGQYQTQYQPGHAPMSELVGDHAGEMDAGVDSQRPPAELDAGSYAVRR